MLLAAWVVGVWGIPIGSGFASNNVGPRSLLAVGVLIGGGFNPISYTIPPRGHIWPQTRGSKYFDRKNKNASLKISAVY